MNVMVQLVGLSLSASSVALQCVPIGRKAVRTFSYATLQRLGFVFHVVEFHATALLIGKYKRTLLLYGINCSL